MIDRIDRRTFLKRGLAATTLFVAPQLRACTIRLTNPFGSEQPIEINPQDLYKEINKLGGPDGITSITDDANNIEQELCEGTSEWRYKECADGVYFNDLTRLKSANEFREEMQNLYESGELIYSTDRNQRTVEHIVPFSLWESFTSRDVHFTGWITRHTDYLNKLLRENNLPIETVTSAVIVVSDLVAKELVAGHKPPSEDILPEGLYLRRVYEVEYNPWDDDGAEVRYSEEYDLDNGHLHELGHYLLLLPDNYFLDVNTSNVKFYARDLDGGEVPHDRQDYSLNPNWLMSGGSSGNLTLSPYEVKSIRRLQELGISSWNAAYTYWVKEAYREIGDVRLRLPDEFIEASVQIFEAKPVELNDPWTLIRQYESEADEVRLVDRDSSVVLPKSLTGGYIYDHRSENGFDFSYGKNLFLIFNRQDGEKDYLHLNSIHFLEATWDNRGNKSVTTIDFRTPTV